MQLTTRNASLADLAALLTDQHTRKLDMIVPAGKLRSEQGVLVVEGAEPVIEDQGVTPADGRYRPTTICDEGLADKLGIPVAYLKRLRQDRPDLFDANVNGWLHGDGREAVPQSENQALPDGRSFLLRCFRGDDGEGVARAFLSDRFKIIDNLDVLTAALDGVKQTGTEIQVVGADLTERRMFVRIAAPAISALAPKLLDGYRSPTFGNIERVRQIAAREGQGYEPGSEPVVFAGFELSNSETGDGSFLITPRLVVQICMNGLKVTADALKAIHLGGRQEEGIVRWSAETQQKQLELVTAQARDAVATFLDVDYVSLVLDRISDKAATPVAGAQEVVQTVCKTLRFSEEQTAGILDHFIQGGQMTAGGVMQAVTSYAQVEPDAEQAAAMEGAALQALELAAA